MSSLIEKDNSNILLIKGAPELLLERCAYIQKGKEIKLMNESVKKEILCEIEKLQIKAMRTLGFAYKKIDHIMDEVALTAQENLDINNDLEKYDKCNDLIFSGFVGIVDPLREGVKESIQIAYEAGVKVKMLTGDNINTAKAIGEELGLLKENKQ